MIVCEGPDGAGKSTLVEHLAEMFDLAIGERGVANRDHLYKVTRQDTYKALSMGVLGSQPRIWDRLFVSEFVYADLVGRPCEFSQAEAEFIVATMNALAFPMIVCLPPLDVVKENVAKAHQMKGVNEHLSGIYFTYDQGILPWPENLIYYDYTGHNKDFASLDEVEDEVAGYLKTRKEREAWHSN